LGTQNKLTLSHNYFQLHIVDVDPHRDEGRISWRNNKFPPVLTAQSSIIVRAVAREPTN